MIATIRVLRRLIIPVLCIKLNPAYQDFHAQTNDFSNSRQPIITERCEVIATDIAIAGQVGAAAGSAAGPLPIRCEKSKIPHLNFAVKIHVAVTAGVSQGQFVELKLDASGFNKSHDLDIRIESDSRHYIGPGLPTRRYCPQSHHDRLFLAEPIL
jgi:hypothetical protein